MYIYRFNASKAVQKAIFIKELLVVTRLRRNYDWQLKMAYCFICGLKIFVSYVVERFIMRMHSLITCNSM